MHVHEPKSLKKKHILKHVTNLATLAPLLAAVVAPLSVLLDIPALTENWYAQNGSPLPDPRACLILSGISLVFAVIAEAGLLVVFSVYVGWWRIAIHVSVLSWLVKVAVSVTNLVVFGVLSRTEPSFSYDEGFWCAILSFLTSFLVFFLLAFHWAFEFLHLGKLAGVHSYSLSVRREGRHFMMQNLYFMALIGITALIFSKLEGWSYLQGIYFAVVTFETVGFGSDFVPTGTAGRIILFPLALLGIAQLTVLVSDLINFASSRTAKRRAKSRLKFEKDRRAAEKEETDPKSLTAEIDFLEGLHRQRDWREHGVELAWSLGCFAAFWFLGALIFSSTEGWPFGVGLYFCYIFFLAIGYGDVYVSSPAGRAIFVVYSLIAVPIMTSFAMQTISSIFTNLSQSSLTGHKASAMFQPKKKHKTAQEEEEGGDVTEEELVSHAEYVSRFRKKQGKQGAQKEEAAHAESVASDAQEGQEQEDEKSWTRVDSNAQDTVDATEDRESEKGAEEDQQNHARRRDAKADANDNTDGGGTDHPEKQFPRGFAERSREKNERHRGIRADANYNTTGGADENRQKNPGAGAGSEDDDEPEVGSESEAVAEAEADEAASERGKPTRAEQRDEEQDADLTERVLETAATLERHARRLLIFNLPEGSRQQVLLKADWVVQLAEMRAVLAEKASEAGKARAKKEGEGKKEAEDEEEKMRKRVEEEAELVLRPLDDEETMKEIKRYRECFASLLVSGSRLRKLKGRQRYIFERRKGQDGGETDEEGSIVDPPQSENGSTHNPSGDDRKKDE